MNNPWLSIPALEYDLHMGHATVRQREFLDSVFEAAIIKVQPKSLALLGCATGGGLQLVNARQVERVVAVDINPEYLEWTRLRFLDQLPSLELLEADIETCDLDSGAFDLIHCALVLEYVDVSIALENMARWLSKAGVLVIVLQLPSPGASAVTETGCESLKLLEMDLQNPEDIREKASCVRLQEVSFQMTVLDTGKQFYIGHYMLEEH